MFTKYKKHLIIASAVILVLVLALIAALNIEAIKGWFAPETPDTPDTPSTPDTPKAETLYYVPFEDFASIVIENEFGTVEIVSDISFIYTVKDFDKPIDDDTITSVVVTATEVDYTQIIAENCTDLAQYGLANPLARFTVTDKSGNSKSFLVGNASADGLGAYLCEEGKNTVYLTNQYISDFTVIKLASLVKLEVIPEVDTENNIEALSKVRINSETTGWQDIILEYSEAAASEDNSGKAYYPFVLTQPASGFIVNGDYFENYIYKALGGVTAMVAVYVYPTQEQLEECFLTDPWGELELVIDGKTYDMVVSKPVNEDYCYVLMNDVIYFTDKANFVCLDATIMAIQSRFIFLDSISNFSNINVTYGGNTYRFAQKGTMFDEEDEWSVTTNGKATDGDEFKKLYTLMLSLFIDGMTTPEDTVGDKMLEITFKYANSSEEVKITYYQVDYRRCAVQFNNDPISYYTMRKYVDKFVNALNNYLNGDTIDLYS